ncbi:AsnC family protein [Nocardia sp. NPDC001965]
MSRLTDSGHAGAMVHFFADGMSGERWDATGPLVTIDADGTPLPVDRWSTRSAAEIVGWRAICTTYSSYPNGWRRCWTGPDWIRVAALADQDLDARKVHWPSEVAFFAPLDDALIMVDWEVHAGPPAAELHEVGRHADAVADAQGKLDLAVHIARDAGASWADIGREVGISRQSAHDRWARRLAK